MDHSLAISMVVQGLQKLATTYSMEKVMARKC
jgi:hypothetical protein